MPETISAEQDFASVQQENCIECNDTGALRLKEEWSEESLGL